ncbi:MULTISPECIES: hypothetical protein [unclassified Wolbachia]|uniref:hypothetical protein n=1 Tax=unclassified Wolbachia TaxID=2640676 RepID=UPI00223119FB|nr:hypothetical protein [Wolbachia endosymbiont (group A) of Apoderus coryli]
MNFVSSHQIFSVAMQQSPLGSSFCIKNVCFSIKQLPLVISSVCLLIIKIPGFQWALLYRYL